MAADAGAAHDIAAAVLVTLEDALARSAPGTLMPELAGLLAQPQASQR
jgi:hypothetical protein